MKLSVFESSKRIKMVSGTARLKLPEPVIPEYENDEQLKRALHQVCVNGLLQVLLDLGIKEKLDDSFTTASLRANLNIKESYDRLFHELIRVLCEKDILNNKAQGLKLAETAETALRGFDLEESFRLLTDIYPDYASHFRLLEKCLNSLENILQGGKRATDVIFPEGDLSLVSGIYRGNYQADYFNDLLASLIESSVAAQVEDLKPGAKIRIMEIGAGTGGTSEILFNKLAPYKDYLEYIYTDISKSFLLHAETQYKGVAPNLKTMLFNIEVPPHEQDIPIGTCDIVIGANVIHATKNISNSLDNIKAVLKKNGLIILNEIVRAELSTTLIFGLLDGWWLYEDEDIRIDGCPGLSPENWQQVLEETGFMQVVSYPRIKGLAQQIIVGQSDGMVTCPIAPTSTSIAPLVAETTAERKSTVVQNTEVEVAWLQERLIMIASETIKLPVEKFTLEKTFLAYGFDSILGQTLLKNINRSLSISLHPTDIFNYPNIKTLAGYIQEEFADVLVVGSGEENSRTPQQNLPQWMNRN